MIQLAGENDDLIPLIWQMSDPPSPGGGSRFLMYGGEAYPYGIFGGALSYTGEDSPYSQYQEFFNQLTGEETPWQIDLQYGLNEDENHFIRAEIYLEEDSQSDSVQILFALTRHDQSNYSALVMNSSFHQQATISQAGESLIVEQVFAAEDYYDLSAMRAVAVLQDINTRQILQSAQTPVTQLIPDLQVNLFSGPASLGIYFTSTSFPEQGIDSWQWDFENDGIIDSEEQNPYFVYEQPGVYDVKLIISNGEEEAEREFMELITVTDTDEIEGSVTGVWSEQFSPYTIIDDVSIPYYGELIIEPGTEIIFDYNTRLNVYGKLQALGSEESPVIFSSDSSWKGIKLLNTYEDNRLEWVEISNASLSALNASYSALEIHNSIFYNNSSGSLGAALNLLGCEEVVIAGSRFFNNTSSLTGGISLRSSHPLITNSIIANNEGNMAGGLVIREGSDPVLINNVIAANSAPLSAIFVDESTPEFVNNILLDEDDVFLADMDAIRINYTISSDDIPGDDNITADPLFIDPTAGSGIDFAALEANWQLQNNSPAIDAGHPDPVYNDPEDPENMGMAAFPALGYIRNDIGAYGGPGVWTDPSVSQDNNIIPAPASELTAYPNPFLHSGGRSTIRFTLEGETGGMLEVYNLRGQKIISFDLEDNSNSISWIPSEQTASGIYFTRWHKDNKSAHTKIILFK